MSYYVLKTPARTRFARRLAAAFIVLTAIISLATGFAMTRPIVVIVDGAEVVVTPETTVADIRASGAFKAPAGDLMGIDGSVITTGGGIPARVLRNGRPTANWQRLYRGDVLISRAGGQRVESVEVTEVAMPFSTRVEGTGPLMSVRREGAPGIKRVTRGASSHLEIESAVIVPPREEVLVRRSPHPGAKLVALTFDDGPWPQSTAAILATLDRFDVSATFFVLGKQVQRYPRMAERIAEDGHLVASHSQTHKRFSKLKPAQVRSEALRSRQVIRDATGVNARWIRPPYGAMSTAAWRELRRLRTGVVMWDVDPKDWQKPGAKKIADRVVRAVRPGSIVLLHDGGGDRTQTLVALPHIIRRLQAKGYIFVTVEELVDADVAKAPAAKALASYRP